jgi:hypothetical protein
MRDSNVCMNLLMSSITSCTPSLREDPRWRGLERTFDSCRSSVSFRPRISPNTAAPSRSARAPSPPSLTLSLTLLERRELLPTQRPREHLRRLGDDLDQAAQQLQLELGLGVVDASQDGVKTTLAESISMKALMQATVDAHSTSSMNTPTFCVKAHVPHSLPCGKSAQQRACTLAQAVPGRPLRRPLRPRDRRSSAPWAHHRSRGRRWRTCRTEQCDPTCAGATHRSGWSSLQRALSDLRLACDSGQHEPS